MSIAQSLLTELEMESANTRKMLQAVPDDKLSFKPHEKSSTMAQLITHLVTVPGWGASTMTTESLDFTGYTPPAPVKTIAEALATFDKGTAEERAAISAAKDEDFSKVWTLSGNGQTFFSLPRMAVLRSFVFNHIIHHRAQLGMYLRMCGAKVPGMYGPSADEAM
jgi:uncharacterized damage-inducible protein DinB